MTEDERQRVAKVTTKIMERIQGSPIRLCVFIATGDHDGVTQTEWTQPDNAPDTAEMIRHLLHLAELLAATVEAKRGRP